MSPLIKRLVLIGGLLFITFAIGFALYMTFKKTEITQTPENNEPISTNPRLPTGGSRTSTVGVGNISGSGSTTLPVANVLPGPDGKTYYVPEKETKITSDFTTFPSVASDGNLRYHNAANGKFYSVAPNGSIKELSGQVFYNIEKVTWSKTSDKAVLEYPDKSKIIYDFNSSKQVSLPKHWQDFARWTGNCCQKYWPLTRESLAHYHE